MSENGAHRRPRVLSPETKWEIFLEVTSREMTQADAARKWQVDVSTIIGIRRAVKDAALAALGTRPRCPACGFRCARVHDTRRRKVRDLEVSGRRTTLVWLRRRFVCDNCSTVFVQPPRRSPTVALVACREVPQRVGRRLSTGRCLESCVLLSLRVNVGSGVVDGPR